MFPLCIGMFARQALAQRKCNYFIEEKKPTKNNENERR